MLKKSRFAKLLLLALLVIMALGFYRGFHDYLPRIPSSPDEATHITFYALGDQGKANSAQRAVAGAMEAQAEKDGGLDFAVLLGDNFYIEDNMTTQSSAWMRAFEHMYTGKYLDAIPFYAVLGNHDYPDSVQAELDYASRHLGSNRWRMPGRHYSEEFGRVNGQPLVQIVFLDTNQDPRGEAEYLKQQFSQGGRQVWKIVIAHHAIRTYGKHHQEGEGVNSALLSAMQAANVDLYIAAHDHNQQLIVRKGEPVQIVSGGGGGKLYAIKPGEPDLRFAASEHGFVRIALDATGVDVSYLDSGDHLQAAFHMDRNCTSGVENCLKQTNAH